MALELDNLTLLLLGLLAVLLMYQRFFALPSPLVHPLLLGKQSDVSPIRRKNETGIYRSFATGQGSPFTVRPANTLKTVNDIVHHPRASNEATPRHILDVELTDEALTEIARLLPNGIRALFPEIIGTDSTSPTPILSVLPPSPSTALPLLLLQLTSHPSAPLIVLPSPTLLTTALTSTSHATPALVVVHVSLVDDVVEQVWEDTRGKAGVLVVGDPSRTKGDVAKAAGGRGLVVRFWEEIWEEAEKMEKVPELLDPIYSDVHSYFYSLPTPSSSTPYVVKITNINITAGIAGVLSLFPADKRPTSAGKDVVASSARLDSPFGMTVALASIWSGAGYRLIGSQSPTWPVEGGTSDAAEELRALTAGSKNEPAPTVLFISSAHHTALVKALQSAFVKQPFASLAVRHKTTSLHAGDVSRKGWWESSVWGPIRQKALGGIAGDRLRAVLVVGDAPPVGTLAIAHTLLSLPFSRIRSSPLSAGPVFGTHFYDIQSPGINTEHIYDHNLLDGLIEEKDTAPKAHSGPPASNIEVLLRGPGIEEEIAAEEAKVNGQVWIRGPGVLERLDLPADDGWVWSGDEAAVQTNGTFVVGSRY